MVATYTKKGIYNVIKSIKKNHKTKQQQQLTFGFPSMILQIKFSSFFFNPNFLQ